MIKVRTRKDTTEAAYNLLTIGGIGFEENGEQVTALLPREVAM